MNKKSENHRWNFEECTSIDNEYIQAMIHKNYNIGMHSHDFYEMNIILNGSRRHKIEGMTIDTDKGDVFIIPPGVNHEYAGGPDVFHILISGYFLTANSEYFTNLSGYSMLFDSAWINKKSIRDKQFLKLSRTELDSIMPYINKLISCNDLSYPSKELTKKAVFFVITAELCRFMYNKNMQQETSEILNKSAIVQSIEFIYSKYGEKITIRDLAQSANMSVSAYTRNFTKMFNIAPYEYVNMFRVKKAKELLINTDLNITQVAQSSGFYDSSHFTRFFKKYEHSTPSAFRKKKNNNNQG